MTPLLEDAQVEPRALDVLGTTEGLVDFGEGSAEALG
jgi:hypothetical protein